jgi:hypothetical protein
LRYSAWVAQTARKEFVIRAGLEAVSQYEAEHGPFTPDEIARADEWAARVTQPSGSPQISGAAADGKRFEGARYSLGIVA